MHSLITANIYRVEGSSSEFIFDAGWNRSKGCQKAFSEARKARGIIISHFHPDHYGCLPFLPKKGEGEGLGDRGSLPSENSAERRERKPLVCEKGDYPVIIYNKLDWDVLRLLGHHEPETSTPNAKSGNRSYSLNSLGDVLREQGIDVNLKGNRMLGLETILGGFDGWNLLSAPGHSPGHLCSISGTDWPLNSPVYEEGGVLLSGDLFFTESSCYVGYPEGNLGDYLKTLEVLIDMHDKGLVRSVLPGHGRMIAGEEVREVISTTHTHRLERHEQVIEALEAMGEAPLRDITRRVYGEIDPLLGEFQMRSVLAHMQRLVEDNKLDKNEFERVLLSSGFEQDI